MLENCTEYDKVDGLLDILGVEEAPGVRWRYLHKVMGVVGVFGGGASTISQDEMDVIEYGLSRELLVSQDWRL